MVIPHGGKIWVLSPHDNKFKTVNFSLAFGIPNFKIIAALC